MTATRYLGQGFGPPFRLTRVPKLLMGRTARIPGIAMAPMQPAGGDGLELWPVSRAFNNVQNDGAERLIPIDGSAASAVIIE